VLPQLEGLGSPAWQSAGAPAGTPLATARCCLICPARLVRASASSSRSGGSGDWSARPGSPTRASPRPRLHRSRLLARLEALGQQLGSSACRLRDPGLCRWHPGPPAAAAPLQLSATASVLKWTMNLFEAAVSPWADQAPVVPPPPAGVRPKAGSIAALIASGTSLL